MTNEQTVKEQSREQTITRRDFSRLNLTPLHVARNWSKADVLLGEWPPQSGQRVVVKDLKPRALWMRLIGGRYSQMREWRALEALQGLEGVPAPVALVDADCFVMEFRGGTPVKQFERGTLSPQVLDKVEALLSEMHRRGVTHGDLHGGNILVDEQGRVSLIDWATSSFFSDEPRGWKATSFANWRALDERALYKLKLLHAPGKLSPQEREALRSGPSGLYRFVKRVRYFLAKLRGKNPSREWMFVSADVRRMLEEEDKQ